MSLKIVFDTTDSSSDEPIKIGPEEVALKIGGETYLPVIEEDGFTAIYQLPETIGEDEIVEALDELPWCYF